MSSKFTARADRSGVIEAGAQRSNNLNESKHSQMQDVCWCFTETYQIWFTSPRFDTRDSGATRDAPSVYTSGKSSIFLVMVPHNLRVDTCLLVAVSQHKIDRRNFHEENSEPR